MNPDALTKRSPPSKELSKSASFLDNQPPRIRKNPWFKRNQKENGHKPIRQTLKKSIQPNFKKKKVNYRDERQKFWLARKLKKASLNNQPAAPHNTTQFIVNTVHFPTDPYIYDFDNERFPNDTMNHSMMGSMRSLMLADFKHPGLSKDNNLLEKPNSQRNSLINLNNEEANSDGDPKDITDGYSNSPYELDKVRSESDAYMIGARRLEERPTLMLSPRPNLAQMDIKSLIQEAKTGQNNLESVLQALLNKIKEKDEIITNLKGN